MFNFTDHPIVYATQYQSITDNIYDFGDFGDFRNYDYYDILCMVRTFIIFITSIYFYGFYNETPDNNNNNNININDLETTEESNDESIITDSDIDVDIESQEDQECEEGEESEESEDINIPNITENYETLIENMSKYDLYVFNRYFMHYLGIDKANFYRILRHITQYLSNTGELYNVPKEDIENNKLSLQKLLPKCWKNDSDILLQTKPKTLKLERSTDSIDPEAVKEINKELEDENKEEHSEEEYDDDPELTLKDAIMRLLTIYKYITEIRYPSDVFICDKNSNVSIDEENLIDLFSKTNPQELMRDFIAIFQGFLNRDYTKDFENFSRRIDPNIVSNLDIELEKENCYENMLMMFIMSSLKTRNGYILNIVKPLE